MSIRSAQRGLSLVEVVIFIVLVSVAIAGVMGVMNTVTAHSADPLVRKQAVAIAEALMEEVLLMPMTYCDADDANVLVATSGAGCAVAGNNQAVTAPQTGESRYSTSAPFDNVMDYNGFNTATASLTGIRTIDGGAVSGLSGYTATVSASATALAGTSYTVSAGTAVLISVTVTGPDGQSVRLQAYRTRYAPRNP